MVYEINRIVLDENHEDYQLISDAIEILNQRGEHLNFLRAISGKSEAGNFDSSMSLRDHFTLFRQYEAISSRCDKIIGGRKK